MIEYRNNPNNNIVELTVEGKITEADFDFLRRSVTIQETGFLLQDCRLPFDFDRNPVSPTQPDRPFGCTYPDARSIERSHTI